MFGPRTGTIRHGDLRPGLSGAGRSRILNAIGIAIALLLALWGARVTWIEGVAYALPRQFNGDFRWSMFENVWDGRGILYGPVFVIERWSVNAWPGLFTPEAFGLANVALAAIAFAAGVAATRVGPRVALFALAAWLANNKLYYSLSVAANPEYLELAALSVAWAAASHGRRLVEGAFVGFAAMTKLVPTIFVVQLVARREHGAVLGFALAAATLMIVVGLGQGLDPAQTMLQTLLPFGTPVAGSSVDLAANQGAAFLSREFSGVNSALARTVSFMGTDPGRSAVLIQAMTAGVLLLSIAGAAWVSWSARRAKRQVDMAGIALSYGAFFALLPIVTVSTHPHTFVFLLPAWTALLAVLASDTDMRRRWPFSVFFAITWMLIGFPAAAKLADLALRTERLFQDGWVGLEPIVANIALLAGIVLYQWVRMRSSRRISQTVSGDRPASG